MMPHNELARNKKIITKIKQIDKDQKTNFSQDIIQTDEDKNFIEQFYQNLSQMFNMINSKGGIITFFSFAVFNEITVYRKYNEYSMFKEILDLFTVETEKTRLICRWIFDINNQTMNVYNGRGLISYCYQIVGKQLYLEYVFKDKLNLVIQ